MLMVLEHALHMRFAHVTTSCVPIVPRFGSDVASVRARKHYMKCTTVGLYSLYRLCKKLSPLVTNPQHLHALLGFRSSMTGSALLRLRRCRRGLLALQGCQNGAGRHGQPVHADANGLIDGVGQGR